MLQFALRDEPLAATLAQMTRASGDLDPAGPGSGKWEMLVRQEQETGIWERKYFCFDYVMQLSYIEERLRLLGASHG